MSDRREAAGDAESVRKVLAGDREAFRALVERHQARAFHCALRIVRDTDEAEDLAQEAFVRAYERLASYDSRWAFSTWIATIATRLALNEARRKRAAPEADMNLETEAMPSRAPSPRDQAAGKQGLERLREEVSQLGETMRLVFGLRHEEDMSIAEIANLTNMSVSAVKVSLHRARKQLRERMGDALDWA